MNKILSISIDMGAINNGVFYCEHDRYRILSKKAINFKIDKDRINFSKKSRRENRHRIRSYTRRKLAKRLFSQLYPMNNFSQQERELIIGLFNNRGFTFLNSEDIFEPIKNDTQDFITDFLPNLKNNINKEDFEELLSNYTELKDLELFVENEINNINKYLETKKSDFPKSYQDSQKEIKKDIKNINNLFLDILKEVRNGAKPRKKYLKEIKDEIETFSFIDNKRELYNIVGNISNLQLRVLRKLLNTNKENQYKKLYNYFLFFHYKTEDEVNRKSELFKILNTTTILLDFLKKCNPLFTIPPYEDMNNRHTYKCNSLHLKPTMSKNQKQAIYDIFNSEYFEYLTHIFNEQIEGNEVKYLQRLLDVKLDSNNKPFHPRNVFKFKNATSIKFFKRLFGQNIYNELKDIAEKYYNEETKIQNGVFDERTSIFKKCALNTPYKNNIKDILLKPIYGCYFSKDDAGNFIDAINNTRGLKSYMETISKKAKVYQNRFYFVVSECLDNHKCANDKDIEKIVKNLNTKTLQIKEILCNLDIKNSYFDNFEKIDNDNIKRVINIFKQTFEVLLKDINGFSKTCKYCTIENNLRSGEGNVIAKRLLSNVGKPIDGILDAMLDRVAFEIVDNIENLKDIKEVEIFLEQNRFNFEDDLSEIKRKKNKKTILKESEICPYTGRKFNKGDYDHILPQSKGLFNSKANLIYVSSEGNKIKGNKYYHIEELAKEHLKDVFKTEDINKIKKTISDNIKTINENKFKNFDNLSTNQQLSFRYALFFNENSEEFKKAKNLLLKDRIKTFTNGTQKRLINLIYKKLQDKFGNINLNAKVVNSDIVSATRKFLAVDQNTGEINNLFKEEIQDSHSHCIDAMVVFYLANAKIKGQLHKQKNHISQITPLFDFKEIYTDSSKINTIAKRKNFVNSDKNEIKSYKLFNDTIYSENYKHVTKDSLKEDQLLLLIQNNLLYKNTNNKKYFIKDINEIVDSIIYKIDIQRTSNLLYKLFNEEDVNMLVKFKFLDKLRYSTSRKSLEDIFFNTKRDGLVDFEKIKYPPYRRKIFKAIYNQLKILPSLFETSIQTKKDKDDNEVEIKHTKLNYKVLNDFISSLYLSKQKKPLSKKRGKRKHIWSLPVIGSPKFRIKRGSIWQVYSNNDISTKHYIVNNKVISIPFYSKNVIPLNVSDLLDCLLLKKAINIYNISINIDEVATYIKSLQYFLTEKSRCTVRVSLNIAAFEIDFKNIKVFSGNEDKEFRKFIELYLNNKKLLLNKYIGDIRDGLKGKATLLSIDDNTIVLEYKANITKAKKDLILKSYNETSIGE